MSLYRYVKSPKSSAIAVDIRPKFLSFTSYTLIGFGIFLIGNAAFPLVSYELFRSGNTFFRTESHTQTISAPQVLSESSQVSPNLADSSNWFPDANSKSVPALSQGYTPGNIEFYNLSIPKLKIKNAVVSVGSTDLGQSLVHYSGTALPGDLGNPVIFGHSVLPQFFNPKNYISIFSTIHTLEKGDLVITNFDGIEYRYAVSEKFEVKPTDLYVLNQNYSIRELSLITCSPPGTYLRRLVVKAKLIDNKL